MVSDWTSCTSNRILKLDTHDNATKGQNTHYCWVHCPQNIRKRNTQFKHTCPTAYWRAYAELAAPQTMMVGQCLSKVIIWFYSIGDVVDSMFVFSSLMHFKDCYTAVNRLQYYWCSSIWIYKQHFEGYQMIWKNLHFRKQPLLNKDD